MAIDGRKVLRLNLPLWQGGDRPDYRIGGRVLAAIVPEPLGPEETVAVPRAAGGERPVEGGIVSRRALLELLAAARSAIERHAPEAIVTLGGNEDAGSYSVGVGMDVRNQYRFDLKYVDNFGPFDTCDAAGTAPAGGIQGEGATPGANGMYNCTVGQPTAFAGVPSQLKDRGMVTLTFKTTF